MTQLTRRPDVPIATIRGSSRVAIATEWLGRLAAVLAVVLFALVLTAVHKGLLVQSSSRTIVDNFHTTNDLFADRADLGAPATARRQLDELAGVLTQLDTSAAETVNRLQGLQPDAQALLAAGQSDTQIANELQTVAATLQGSAASLHDIAANADGTVSAINDQLSRAIELVTSLNNELRRTTNKLAPIPAQDALIPAPGGN
jgi:hypothetical protein